MNRSGEWIRGYLSGLNARIFQHEMDHLNGILFIDYLKDPQQLYKEQDN
jgi:peptide deformylase